MDGARAEVVLEGALVLQIERWRHPLLAQEKDRNTGAVRHGDLVEDVRIEAGEDADAKVRRQDVVEHLL